MTTPVTDLLTETPSNRSLLSLESIEAGAKKCGLSEERKLAFIGYLHRRVYPGRVVAHALLNDFASLAQLAESDPFIKEDLVPMGRFLRDHCPVHVWGSAEAVRAWLWRDMDNEPVECLWWVDLGGVPIGIFRSPSALTASLEARARVMKTSAPNLAEVPFVEVYRGWVAWCGENQVSHDDMRIGLLARLPGGESFDTGVPEWGVEQPKPSSGPSSA